MLKSFFQESTSVCKAVDQAWVKAGNPKTFTINIISQGETNFFGFSKNPAVISFTYSHDSVKSPYQEQRKTTHSSSHSTQRPVSPTVQPKSVAPSTRREPQEKPPRSPLVKKTEVTPLNEAWNEKLEHETGEFVDGFLKTLDSSANFKLVKTIDNELILQISNFEQENADLFSKNMVACAFASLITQSLRNKSGQRLKNLKIKIQIC